MKAIEYFEKYKSKIDTQEGLSELIKEMSAEVEIIANSRNASTDNAGRAIFKELNQKWNKLARIFEQEFKKPILCEDGFLNFWKSKIPSL